jgi:hypothetical protein
MEAQHPMVNLEDLEREQVLGLIEDAVRNIASHGALWFRAVEKELGLEEAIRLDEMAWRRGLPIQTKRLLGRATSEQKADLTTFPEAWTKAELTRLLQDLAKNWSANDGVWFQAVEQKHGMAIAKKCNDQAWETFTVIEAKRIMSRIGIEANSGLDGLDQALGFRLSAHLNKQSIKRIGDTKLVFEMNACRVQSARKRAGLADYPCKSGGLIEYPFFARAIDPRITTRCIYCPPDEHPDDVWCAWEFELK